MLFEWDAAKSDATRAARGFGFEEVTAVFLDPGRVTFQDDRKDYGEVRWTAFGLIEGRLFAVTYTWRGEAVRIVSARKANARERKRYDGNQDLPT
ncbi:BrnT family toxin [Pseudoroseicyclus tamaricis]|uniref:BrnT family toxin n=1 Tax=Pseudoroseicyclus tamaricis TaxID=2705421 RepID=A0A6B2JHZ6_9RHOB|nr:BrnT family toxin [Pseudoroseicyclus tamaricis]NDV00943.1 BrnT family toxin [Pseudoroseicyclus tamaricis]